MSDIENQQDARENVNHDMMFIAEKLLAHPEILEKSQVPAKKMKKTSVLTKIVEEYVMIFGKEIEIKTFMKKVNNMKARLKNKTDKNKIGNKRICLLPWEKIMFEAMNADIKPVLCEVSGAVAIGASMTASGMSNYRKRSFEPRIQEKNYNVPKKLRPRPKLPSNSAVVDARPEETDETKQLTTAQLQRLVLIEQLKTARLQQEYYSTQLERLSKTSNKETSNTYTTIEDNTAVV